MPLGSKNGGTPPTNGSQERPVIFQKYFKSNNRTYASQIKLSQIGKKYLVLTQGVRDPETDQLKKHTIFVFEQDLKDFFAMLQETVVYLKSARSDVGSSVAGIMAPKPAESGPAAGASGPAKPPIAKTPARPSGSSTRPPAMVAKPAAGKVAIAGRAAAKPAPVRAATAPNPGKPVQKNAYRTGSRTGGR